MNATTINKKQCSLALASLIACSSLFGNAWSPSAVGQVNSLTEDSILSRIPNNNVIDKCHYGCLIIIRYRYLNIVIVASTCISHPKKLHAEHFLYMCELRSLKVLQGINLIDYKQYREFKTLILDSANPTFVRNKLFLRIFSLHHYNTS
jgi:hypothetical protein